MSLKDYSCISLIKSIYEMFHKVLLLDIRR